MYKIDKKGQNHQKQQKKSENDIYNAVGPKSQKLLLVKRFLIFHQVM